MLTHSNFSSADWALQANEYQHIKKTLPWGHTEKPLAVTHRIIKAKDGIFNPILQTYNNASTEDHSRKVEKTVKSEHLAKSLVY